MVVLSHGKKKPTDTHTILELEFTFDFDKKPKKVVFPVYDPSFKSALGIILTNLQRIPSLEGCHPKDTFKHFPSFMLQEVILYQERLDALGATSQDTRPYREYSQPTVEKFSLQWRSFKIDITSLLLKFLTSLTVAGNFPQKRQTTFLLGLHTLEKKSSSNRILERLLRS